MGGTANALKVDGRSKRAAALRRARRSQILDAAAAVFRSRGYHGTSLNDVLDEAGIARGTFYLYFDGKAQLFHELIDGFFEQLRDAVEVVHPDDPAPQARVLANIRRVIGLLFDHRDRTTLFLHEASGLDDEVDRKLRDLHAFLYENVAGALQGGEALGLTRRVNHRIVATAVIGVIKEVCWQYLVLQPAEQPDRETVTQEVFGFLMNGLRRQP